MMAKVSIFIVQSVWCHINSVEATLPPRGCKIGSVLREWKKKSDMLCVYLGTLY